MRKAVILAVGSYDPPTNAHLRMLEDAKITLKKKGIEVVEGIMSPVSRGLDKKLSPNYQRFAMVSAATSTSSWIRADSWECSQRDVNTLVNVVKHHKEQTAKKHGDHTLLFLVVGGDVIDTFAHRDEDGSPLWKTSDLIEIITGGLIIQKRLGSDPEGTLEKMEELYDYTPPIVYINNPLSTDSISSGRLREEVKQGNSIQYATPDAVVDFIRENMLYKN